MPRMTEKLTVRLSEKNAIEKTALIRKRFALLSFFDKCFYSFAFGLLLISPVNASDSYTDEREASLGTLAGINIYASHLTEELETHCKTNITVTCELNVLSQPSLVTALQQADATGYIISALGNSDYEVLIGSARVKNNNSIHELVLEISANWHGITIEDKHLRTNLDSSISDFTESVSEASNRLLKQWVEYALRKQLFSAEFLYQFLGASNYTTELKVPKQIGDFALSRQHLFNDPLKGMLSRYIHKDFELAVFDVYVYPLKSNDPVLTESQNELLREQQDIRSISKALGKDSLTMTEIYEVNNLVGLQDIRVFAFEAKLQTDSEPLFATQYAYVKNDKVVKFSVNVPARITDGLIVDAINAIVVPPESSMMKQVRQNNMSQGSSRIVSTAP